MKRQRQWFWVLRIAVLAWAVPVFGPGEAAASAPEIRLAVPLSDGAAAKVDPAIRLALSIPNKSLRTLAPIARNIEIGGTSPADPRFPVLIRTSMSDAELAAIGVARDSRAGDIVTAVVSAEDLEALASDPRVSLIEASRRLLPALDASIPDCRANLVNDVGDPPAGYTGRGVMVGLVDTGLDHTHDDFKKPDGTSRIIAIWDQWRDGSPPAGYNYGTEYTKAMIDAGQASQHVDTGAHGSHVMGIAAGDGSSLTNHPYRGVAWEADIIGVSNAYCDLFCYGGGIPPWDNGGLYGQYGGGKGALDGLSYMLAKANSLGKKLAVNQSQGVIKGPHDGTTLLEQAYTNLVNQNGLIIAISAGNDQDANWHGRANVPAGGQAVFTLSKTYVDNPQDPGRYYIDFECWYAAGKSFRWQVVSPGGSVLDMPSSVPPQNYPGAITAEPDTVWYWTSTSHPANSQGYASFIVWDFSTQGVESGDWTVRAISENNSSGQVDLYCERNQYSVQVGASTVSLEGNMGMPGSSDGAITVASYNTKTTWMGADGQQHTTTWGGALSDLSTFSSHGPRRDGVQKPDLAAPGYQIMSVYASGSQTDASNIHPQLRHRIMAGTSMASPHVAGTIALMLQKDPTLTPAQVKQILRSSARQDAFTGSVPNFSWGYGKLDVKAAVDAVGGGSVSCATQLGDANQDNLVNVFDLVATVNDILQTTPLGQAGRNCADVDASGTINIFDLIGIVNRILNPGMLAPWVASDGASEPVAWGQNLNESGLAFTVDGSRVGGLEISLLLPRGYLAGEAAALENAAPAARAALHAIGNSVTVVAYNPQARALGEGPITLRVPLRRAWNGGRAIESLEVARLLVADPRGGALSLADRPTLSGGPTDRTAGVAAWLEAAAPNPALDRTQVRYRLDGDGPVTLTVHDASGRLVRRLWDGWQAAGGHTLVWDGRDERSNTVPAGAYFVRIESNRGTDSQKLMIMR